VSGITTLYYGMLRLLFIVECGIACFHWAMRVFEVRSSSSPLGYLCVNFRFFPSLHCWASPWGKIAYSITHSLIQSPSLFDAPGTEALALRNSKSVFGRRKGFA